MSSTRAAEAMALRLLAFAAAFAAVIALAACGGSEEATQSTPTPPPPPIAEAHEAFLAWFEDYAQEHGLAAEIAPAGQQEEGLCWSVTDSSDTEVLYALAQCPVKGITVARVLQRDGKWKAAQSHFQLSVGRASVTEITNNITQGMPPDSTAKLVLDRGTEVVAVIGPPSVTPEIAFLNLYRFEQGEDSLWRAYHSYDAIHGGFVLPLDALVAYAVKNLPEFTILGDCQGAKKPDDADKVCWTAVAEKENSRTYTIGPAFLEVRRKKVELLFRDRPSAPGAPAWFGQPEGAFP